MFHQPTPPPEGVTLRRFESVALSKIATRAGVTTKALGAELRDVFRSRRSRIDNAEVSRIVSNLEILGYIAVEKDGRTKIVRATMKGRTEMIQPAHRILAALGYAHG